MYERVIEDFHLLHPKLNEEDAEAQINRFIRPFDLSTAPLIRAELLSISSARHLLLIDTHHIIADGVSRSLFVKEIAQLYKGASLPEPKLHYKDYAVWQQQPDQQAIWGTVLAKYNRSEDVVFGTVVSGRPSEIDGIEHMAGLFINTIPVRLRVDQNASFAELFKQAQQHAIDAERYDYLPLYEIQKQSALDGRLISIRSKFADRESSWAKSSIIS